MPLINLIVKVPKEHEEDFKSVKKFNVFNTNNLWMRLDTVQEYSSLDV